MLDSFTFYKGSKVHIAFKSIIDVFSSVHVVGEHEIPCSSFVPKEYIPEIVVVLTLSSSSPVITNLRTIYVCLNSIL